MAAHKKILLTLLEPNEGLARLLGTEIQRMGIDVQAHCREWGIDAVGALIAELSRQEYQAWCIAGEQKNFADPALMRELSLTALGAQAAHGNAFPIILAPNGGMVENLPAPLQGASQAVRAVGAKVAAQLAMPHKAAPQEYRLNVHCPMGLGLWLEIGTVQHPWQGAFLGTAGSNAQGKAIVPLAHGVGLAGRIPERSTLNFPLQDMKIAAGGQEFTAWGVKNPLTVDLSYFIKLSAIPDAVLFGEFPENDAPEVFVLGLV
jgi:hypothetical protein